MCCLSQVTSGYFAAMNRGKESLSVDLQQEAGREIIYKLVEKADVVVQNFVPGEAEKLGIIKNQGNRILGRLSKLRAKKLSFLKDNMVSKYVTIAFSAEMAGYVRERSWHESQQLADEPDGGVRLTMEVAPGFELQAWIKGFLPHVRVARPASLRDAIARDLAAAQSAFPAPK